jgi:hypothetical protein
MSQALPPAMSESEIRKNAASQIDLEIGQATAPIQSQITTTQANRDRSLGQIGGMFDALQPVVNQAATAVQSSYDQAMSQEHAVFAEAQSQLQTLRGNRAADAQAMAQKIGGPVAMDEWTQPFDNAATDLTYLGAGQQLHTLAYAQAGEQQAQAFAGQVFPLVRTEQMASVRNQFEDQIREYEDQIVALKSQKGAQVNKRYNELRAQELDYGLKRAQQQLEKLDSQRSYNLAVKKAKFDKAESNRTYQLNKQELGVTKKKNADDLKVALLLAGDNKRKTDLAYKQYDLATKEYELSKGVQTGYVDGKPTVQQKQTDAQIDQAAAMLDFNKAELKQKKHEFKINAKIEKNKLTKDQSTDWVALMDNAIHPQPGKTITRTVQKPISLDTAMVTDGAYSEDGVHWVVNQEVTETLGITSPITDPNMLVDYLVTAMNDEDFGRARAVKLIQTRFPAYKNWKYGQPDPAKKRKGKGMMGIEDVRQLGQGPS